MPMPQKHPLRPLTEQEEQELRRIEKASSERVDVVRRARALLAVAAKQTFPQAASSAGFAEARSVSQLVERFNQQGLAALSIAAGRGRKPTYTSQQQARILAQVQRKPDRQEDQTATWSLMTLRGHCARAICLALPKKPFARCCTSMATAINARARGVGRATRCASARAAR